MNNSIFFFFNNFSNQSGFLDMLIIFFANILPFLVVIGVVLFLIFHHESPANEKSLKSFFKKGGEVFYSFIVGLFALFLAELVKNFFVILRPFNAIPEVENLFQATGYAFPSGHATFFMALAFSIYFIHKKVGLILIACALLIGTARVMAGVHYPVDILGGFVFGFFIAVIFNYLLMMSKKS